MDHASPPPRPSDDDVRRGIELIYFGYSHLTRAADDRLAEQGLGRAHHRVLYFVGRQPGLTVSGLLRLLNITKQSLARVLSELTRRGLVEARAGTTDRRQRQLFLTDDGSALERALFDDLSARMRAAYAETDRAGIEGFWDLLMHLVRPEDRSAIAALALGEP